jgi:hypothetical protein
VVNYKELAIAIDGVALAIVDREVLEEDLFACEDITLGSETDMSLVLSESSVTSLAEAGVTIFG